MKTATPLTDSLPSLIPVGGVASPLVLRDYQQDAVDIVWSAMFHKNNILVSAPCGAGKSELTFELCRRAIEVKPAIRILILLNKVSLVAI